MSENYYDVLGRRARRVARRAARRVPAARRRARPPHASGRASPRASCRTNREEVARVRSAWNVLSDPFQRQRYDDQVSPRPERSTATSRSSTTTSPATVPRCSSPGWRKLMAPPPRPAARGGDGDDAAARNDRCDSRPIVLPAGHEDRRAEGARHGAAVRPRRRADHPLRGAVRRAQHDPERLQGQGRPDRSARQRLGRAGGHRRRERRDQRCRHCARDRNAAQNDLQDAQKEFREAQTEFNQKQQDQGLPSDVALPHDVDQLEQRSDTLADDIRTTQYLTALVTLVLALLYLVPVTAKTGSTLGMRGRKIKVVRVDGSPGGLVPGVRPVRDPDPARAGDSDDRAVIGLGLVLWGYRDAERPGCARQARADPRGRGVTSTAFARSDPHVTRREEGDTFMRYVHAFEEGSKEQKYLLGGKGANLAEMTKLGLPVPPGFTITTEACKAYMAAGDRVPDGLMDEVAEARARARGEDGQAARRRRSTRLLVSVRSGAPFSMPGMMDTVLNLGLNDVSVGGLAKQTDNERFACDSYRRFVQMFGKIVLDVDGEKFEDALEEPARGARRRDRSRAHRRRPARPRRPVQGDRARRGGHRVPAGPAGAARPRDRGGVPFVERRARARLPQAWRRSPTTSAPP